MSKTIYTHHYTYWIIDNLNHMGYIGVRTCHTKHINDDPYMGSGESLKPAIRTSGKEHFTKYILATHPDRHTAVRHEIDLHNKYDVAVSLRFYNMAKQTATGFDRTGMCHSEETKKRISSSNIGLTKGVPCSAVTKALISKANTGKKHKPHSTETKIKMSVAQKGKPKTKQHAENISAGKKGLVVSAETRKRMSEAHTTRPPTTQETKDKISKALLRSYAASRCSQ